MMRNLLTLRQIAQKNIFAVPRRQIKSKVAENQKRFQQDDDLPVHLKGGFSDVVLYRFTTFLCVFGTGYSMWLMFGPSKKKA